MQTGTPDNRRGVLVPAAAAAVTLALVGVVAAVGSQEGGTTVPAAEPLVTPARSPEQSGPSASGPAGGPARETVEVAPPATVTSATAPPTNAPPPTTAPPTTAPPTTAPPTTAPPTTAPRPMPLSTEELVGYWANTGGYTSLFVDFRRDGTFTIGNTGRLGAGAFNVGTYEQIDDTTIGFAVPEQAGECAGFAWTWDVSLTDAGVMASAIGCGGSESRWQWTRISPASAAGLGLRPGEADVEPSTPTTSRDVVGIWLRLGTSTVVVIDSDGSYLVTTSGDSLAPDDAGRIEVGSGGEITFVSDGSGDCVAGETWTWAGVSTASDLLREGNPRGTTLRSTESPVCGSAAGGTVWRLVSPDRPG